MAKMEAFRKLCVRARCAKEMVIAQLLAQSDNNDGINQANR